MAENLFDLLMQIELQVSSELDFELEKVAVIPELNEVGALYNQNCCNYILGDERLKDDWPIAIQEMAFLAGTVAYYHYTENKAKLLKDGILQTYIGKYKNIYMIDKYFQELYNMDDASLEAMRVSFTILAGTMCSQITELIKNNNIPGIQAAIPDLMMVNYQFGVNYGRHLLED